MSGTEDPASVAMAHAQMFASFMAKMPQCQPDWEMKIVEGWLAIIREFMTMLVAGPSSSSELVDAAQAVLHVHAQAIAGQWDASRTVAAIQPFLEEMDKVLLA